MSIQSIWIYLSSHTHTSATASPIYHQYENFNHFTFIRLSATILIFHLCYWNYCPSHVRVCVCEHFKNKFIKIGWCVCATLLLGSIQMNSTICVTKPANETKKYLFLHCQRKWTNVEHLSTQNVGATADCVDWSNAKKNFRISGFCFAPFILHTWHKSISQDVQWCNSLSN